MRAFLLGLALLLTAPRATLLFICATLFAVAWLGAASADAITLPIVGGPGLGVGVDRICSSDFSTCPFTLVSRPTPVVGAVEYTPGPNAQSFETQMAFEITLAAPASYVGSGSGVTQVELTSLTLFAPSIRVFVVDEGGSLGLFSIGDTTVAVSGSYSQDSLPARTFSSTAILASHFFGCSLFTTAGPDDCVFSMAFPGIRLGPTSDPYDVELTVQIFVPEPGVATLFAVALVGLCLARRVRVPLLCRIARSFVVPAGIPRALAAWKRE